MSHPTDIYLSPPKHLQLISAQYTLYWIIFFTATAMPNSHGRTVLDFLMEYWTVSNFIVKLPPTGYVVLNNIGQYIHLLIKLLLNSRALWCLAVHVQLTKTSAVTVNHIQLLRWVKPNSCGLSQLCTNTIASVYFPYNITL